MNLTSGITIGDFTYGPISVKMPEACDKETTVLTVTLHEGKNREIRKIMEHLGLTVERLKRISYGPYSLGNLEPGEIREAEVTLDLKPYTSPAWQWRLQE